ncbi:MAG: UDP-N-acetylglucosamine 2-epimerase [Candidatus Omnitrophota bacterium]
MKKRKICIITTSRADYGILSRLMKEIQDDFDLKLQVIVSGMHMEKKFGLTYSSIAGDGFTIDEKINMLMTADTAVGICTSIGTGFREFAKALQRLQPDIMVVLGDRYELLPAVVSALIARIPIAHIHGGETSQGAIDEAIRHSITKMSALHFPCAEEYKKRIIQLGENPKYVFNYGAPGLDAFLALQLFEKPQLEDALRFDLNGKLALATYHPATLDSKSPLSQIRSMLAAIKRIDIKVVFTMANADTGGNVVNTEIRNFCRLNRRQYRFCPNLGQKLYFSCMKNFDVMVGNSSSGIIEAPLFKIPVVNVGDRQKGRLRSPNIIDVSCTADAITHGLRRSLQHDFRKGLRNIKSPYLKYFDGKTSYRIKEKLKRVILGDKMLKKEFRDIIFTV